jgi:hypothetical protein
MRSPFEARQPASRPDHTIESAHACSCRLYDHTALSPLAVILKRLHSRTLPQTRLADVSSSPEPLFPAWGSISANRNIRCASRAGQRRLTGTPQKDATFARFSRNFHWIGHCRAEILCALRCWRYGAAGLARSRIAGARAGRLAEGGTYEAYARGLCSSGPDGTPALG